MLSRRLFLARMGLAALALPVLAHRPVLAPPETKEPVATAQGWEIVAYTTPPATMAITNVANVARVEFWSSGVWTGWEPV